MKEEAWATGSAILSARMSLWHGEGNSLPGSVKERERAHKLSCERAGERLFFDLSLPFLPIRVLYGTVQVDGIAVHFLKEFQGERAVIDHVKVL